MNSVKWGGNDSHAGVIHKISRFAGAYPSICGRKGVSLRPLVRRGSVSSNNGLKKRRCVCSARAADT